MIDSWWKLARDVALICLGFAGLGGILVIIFGR